MLDLKKLEEKLDNALNNETEESLKDWLFQKRNKSYLKLFGEGNFETQKKVRNNYIVSSKNIEMTNDSIANSDPLLKIAA